MSEVKKPEVLTVFDSYPPVMRSKLLFLRGLIMETAQEIDDIGSIEETIKWGEPSYLSESGSTIRLAWKKSNPSQYALYFHCKTKLVDTFGELYGDVLKFEGNRAIIFSENDKVPVGEVKHCISMALTYHRVKHLPLLGA